jgi:tetratricopeptide (TPR) repeat protein
MVALLYLKARSWNRLGGNALIAVVISVLVFYAVTTVQLIGDWKNSGTLWTKVIAYQPFDKAYFFRGKYYADNGEYLPAIEDYTTCLAQASKLTIPPIYNIYAFRGEALTRAGFYAEAAADFTTAISMYPHPLYYYHRSLALKGLGKFREANADIRSAGNENGPIQWYE